MDNILKEKMNKSVESFKVELAKIRTGRANISILDDVRVEAYGSPVPLNQVGTLSTPDARLITVQPWDTSLIGPIEKAILKAQLGLTPANDGRIIRIPIPALTEDRRKEFVKMIKKYAEEGKVALRNIRRDANEAIKKQEKAEGLSEDDVKRLLDDVQKVTDSFVAEIDSIAERKEREIMTV